MVSFKPSYMKSDDLQRYNDFFGEMENNQRCYFAPERFRDAYEEGCQSYHKLESSMDIFSAGCIIAEILMDGSPLFDLAKLQLYRRGEYDPERVLRKKIPEGHLVDLVMKMINVNPQERPTASGCLQEWAERAMPLSFSKVLFQLNSRFVLPHYIYSDLRISLVRKYIPTIFKTCFDTKLTT